VASAWAASWLDTWGNSWGATAPPIIFTVSGTLQLSTSLSGASTLQINLTGIGGQSASVPGPGGGDLLLSNATDHVLLSDNISRLLIGSAGTVIASIGKYALSGTDLNTISISGTA
jgi:hypothetical protein